MLILYKWFLVTNIQLTIIICYLQRLEKRGNKKWKKVIFNGIDPYYSQEYVDELVKVANEYYDIIYKIKENCEWSIYSINNILTLNKICPFTKDGKILRNRYQEVRNNEYWFCKYWFTII